MSKGKGQQVMEHSSFQLAKMLSIKNSIILRILSAVYILSPPLLVEGFKYERIEKGICNCSDLESLSQNIEIPITKN